MATSKVLWLLICCLFLVAVVGCSPAATQNTGQTKTSTKTIMVEATSDPTTTSSSTNLSDITVASSDVDEPATPSPNLTTKPYENQSPIVTQTALSSIKPLTTSTVLETKEGKLIMPVSPTKPELSNPAVQQWIRQAKEDLAQRLEVDLEQIKLVSFESKVWPDAGMGCLQPGMAYIQVQVDGYLIILKTNDRLYNYHGGGDSLPFLCEKFDKRKGPPPIALPGIGDE